MSAKPVYNSQRLWGWRIAVYLFLLSAGAGAYVTAFLLSVLGLDGAALPYLTAAKGGVIAAAALTALAVLFFIAGLKAGANAYRVFMRPFSSRLSAGSCLTLLFLVLDLVLIGIWVGPPAGINPAPGIITLLLALAMLAFSGMLLRVLKPFPFWNSRLLSLLLAVSGIIAGAMFVLLIAAVYGFAGTLNMSGPILETVYYLNFCLLAYPVIMGLVVWQSMRNPSSARTATMLLRGRAAFAFWIVVVLLGLMVPLAAGFYLVSAPATAPGTVYSLSIIAALCAVAGSYVLRYLVLILAVPQEITAAGQRVPLHETSFVPVSERVKYR